MHRTRACCRISTVSGQKRYSLTASPGHNSTSVEGMSSRARRSALGSAWMSETMPIFMSFLSVPYSLGGRLSLERQTLLLLCKGFCKSTQEVKRCGSERPEVRWAVMEPRTERANGYQRYLVRLG